MFVQCTYFYFSVVFSCGNSLDESLNLSDSAKAIALSLCKIVAIKSHNCYVFGFNLSELSDLSIMYADPTWENFVKITSMVGSAAAITSRILLVTIGPSFILNHQANSNFGISPILHGCPTSFTDQYLWFTNACRQLRVSFGSNAEINHVHIESQFNFFSSCSLPRPSSQVGIGMIIPSVSPNLVSSSLIPDLMSSAEKPWYILGSIPALIQSFRLSGLFTGVVDERAICDFTYNYFKSKDAYASLLLRNGQTLKDTPFSFPMIKINPRKIHFSRKRFNTPPNIKLSNVKEKSDKLSSSKFPEISPTKALPEALILAMVNNISNTNFDSENRSYSSLNIPQIPLGHWYPPYGADWTRCSGQFDFAKFTSLIPTEIDKSDSELVRIRTRGGYPCTKPLTKLEQYPSAADQSMAVEWAVRKFIAKSCDEQIKDKKHYDWQDKAAEQSSDEQRTYLKQKKSVFFNSVEQPEISEDYDIYSSSSSIKSDTIEVENLKLSDENNDQNDTNVTIHNEFFNSNELLKREIKWDRTRIQLKKNRKLSQTGGKRLSTFFGGRAQDDVIRNTDAKMRLAWDSLEMSGVIVMDNLFDEVDLIMDESSGDEGENNASETPEFMKKAKSINEKAVNKNGNELLSKEKLKLIRIDHSEWGRQFWGLPLIDDEQSAAQTTKEIKINTSNLYPHYEDSYTAQSYSVEMDDLGILNSTQLENFSTFLDSFLNVKSSMDSKKQISSNYQLPDEQDDQ